MGRSPVSQCGSGRIGCFGPLEVGFDHSYVVLVFAKFSTHVFAKEHRLAGLREGRCVGKLAW